MPPHLHPRSRTTSSLFATAVAASFLVVGLPHVLPCPVPRAKYADGEVVVDGRGRRRRWRSTEAPEAAADGVVRFGGPSGDEPAPATRRRECPVPKPGGFLGEWLGFAPR